MAIQREESGREGQTARRLRLLRKVEGFNSTEFATFLGLTGPQYSNYENGVALSKNAAIAMVKKIPGLTLDWLFLGREDGLSVGLLRRLQEAARTDQCNDP